MKNLVLVWLAWTTACCSVLVDARRRGGGGGGDDDDDDDYYNDRSSGRGGGGRNRGGREDDYDYDDYGGGGRRGGGRDSSRRRNNDDDHYDGGGGGGGRRSGGQRGNRRDDYDEYDGYGGGGGGRGRGRNRGRDDYNDPYAAYGGFPGAGGGFPGAGGGFPGAGGFGGGRGGFGGAAGGYGGFGGAAGAGYGGFGGGHGADPYGGGFGGNDPGGRTRERKRASKPDLFENSSQIKNISPQKFPTRSDDDMWLLMFYENDNENSREQGPVMEKLGNKNHLPYKVGAIECTRTKRLVNFCEDLLDEYIPNDMDDDNYPLFAFVKEGKPKFMEVVYEDNSVKDMHEFAMSHMPSRLIENVNKLSVFKEKLLKKKKKIKPSILLLTDKYETSSMYFRLVYQFRNNFIFGESRARNLLLSKEFQVKEYPALFAFVPKGTPGSNPYDDNFGVVKYTGGSFRHRDVARWMDEVLVDIEGGDSGSIPKRRPEEENPPPTPQQKDIVIEEEEDQQSESDEENIDLDEAEEEIEEGSNKVEEEPDEANEGESPGEDAPDESAEAFFGSEEL